MGASIEAPLRAGRLGDAALVLRRRGNACNRRAPSSAIAGESAFVPAHWPTEVMNALLVALRRGRIMPGQAERFARDLAALPIRIDSAASPAAWHAVLRIADRHRLTAYDAAYLHLAQRERLPFATWDEELRRAAISESVPLIPGF